ncbi:hypothetical protein DPX16_23348 [Anabarilius grahami]|uniref:Uncharacterized protein n=1 Tax=Anabarilius grahami TaxID=495550 RepID=A0A3N0Y106_ANAGA|nr:hypothetical protein DPX16_23348 [Anabarilius grahami]
MRFLNSCFLRGLDEDTIRFYEPECLYSLVESINLILFLNGSEFEIEEVHRRSYSPRPAPSEATMAWPAHPPPTSSTYRSSGCAPWVQLNTTPKPSKRRANKRSRRAKRPAILEPAPAFAEPAPVPVGLLITYERMFWIPSPDPSPAFHEPQEEVEYLMDFQAEPMFPAFHVPAPVFAEHAPAAKVSALDVPEPSSSACEPAPAAAAPKPAEIFFLGGPSTRGWGTCGRHAYALLADLENSAFPLGRYPVLLTSDPPVNSDPSSSAQDPTPNRPHPPAYTPQQVCHEHK